MRSLFFANGIIFGKNSSKNTYFRQVNTKKRILIAPLDWGLGHASRCIPIARQLVKEGFEVVFAASGRPLDLLMGEFPNCDFIKFEGYNIHYPKNGNMAWSMISQSLKIWKGIRKEHKVLNQIIEDYNINGVISDNRFGLYSKKIPCVFVTHQLNIQSPILGQWIQHINYKYIEKYDACWIPDSDNYLLSGDLTRTNLPQVDCHFLGSLSRFEPMQKTEDLDILAVISGPEPQRTLFEDILKKQLLASTKKALLVLGKTEDQTEEQIENLTIVGHLKSKELNQAMVNADVVISRSGYSTVMDIAALNKKAIFVPTPGQTEQVYLAKYYYDQQLTFAMPQHKFDLKFALEKVTDFKGLELNEKPCDWKSLFALF